MEIFEFISKGLKAEEKVKVTLKDNTTQEYFFDGYDIPSGTTMNDIASLIPIFRKVSKNGRMLRNRVYLYLGDITKIEGEKFNKITLAQIHEMNQADGIIQERAHDILIELVKEMDSLFPGKKIIFDEEGARTINATIPDKYDVSAADICALYVKDDTVMCDVYAYDDLIQKKLADLTNVDYALLLETLTENIKTPYLDDVREGGFAQPLRSDAVPKADMEKHPVLSWTLLLKFLTANLWYYELLEKDPEDTNRQFGNWHQMDDYDRWGAYLENNKNDD